jgi:hypothetical protein
MPCDTITTLSTVLNADRLDLVAKAAAEAFNIPVPVLRDGVLRFQARDAWVIIQTGQILTETRGRYGAQATAETISRDLHLAYGRVTTRDLADRLGWRVECDVSDPNILTLVRE